MTIKIIKKGLIICAVLIAAISVYFFAYYTYLNNHPDQLKATIQKQLQTSFNSDISIASAHMQLYKGLRIMLAGFETKPTNGFSLKAVQVNAIVSPWQMLLGKVQIRSLKLLQPEIIVRAETFDFNLADRRAFPPVIEIENGSIRFWVGQKNYVFNHIRGSLDRKEIYLQTELFGGRVTLQAKQTHDQWQAQCRFKGLQFEFFDSRASGSANIDIDIETGRFPTRIKLKAATHNLVLPWNRRQCGSINFGFTAHGGSGRFDIADIHLDSNLIQLSGRGVIQPFNGLKRILTSGLTLALTSRSFDYDKMIAWLPTDLFPDWIQRLLSSQIRGGSFRFTGISYSGRLYELKQAKTLKNNLVVTGKFSDLSFGSGKGPERIIGISGLTSYSAGDLNFSDLSGFSGISRIKKVSLEFADITGPETNVSVGVDLNMDAGDFISAWRAAMVPDPFYQFFASVSRITGGRIIAKTFLQSVASGESIRAKGSIRLDDCFFHWNQHPLKNISGTIVCPDFNTAIAIEATGRTADTRIKSFKLLLEKPFDHIVYQYVITVAGLPDISVFHLHPETDITLKGNGDGKKFKGNIGIRTNGFHLFGADFKPKTGTISGQGKLTGTFQPEFEIDITDLKLILPADEMVIQSKVRIDGGNVQLKGRINFSQFDTFAITCCPPYMGTLSTDLRISWGEKTGINGQIICENTGFYHRDIPVAVNGTVKFRNQDISGNNLNFTWGHSTATVLGTLSWDNPIRFVGNLLVDGLTINNRISPDLNFLNALVAHFSLGITDLNIYGIPFGHTIANGIIKNGSLSLDDVRINGTSGNIRGSAEFKANGDSRIDLAGALNTAGTEKLFDAFLPQKSWITGEMAFKGRIHGPVNAINGELRFSAQNGRILTSYLIDDIFGILNFYKIVKSRQIEIATDHFAYNHISSAFDINNGIVSFDDFSLDSNSYQLSAVGEYSLIESRIDATVGLQPLETLDKTISLVPLLGWIITGDEGKFIVINMTVKGEVENPSVKIAPINTLKKPVVEVFKRTFKLPAEIFNKTKEFFPGRTEDQP